eukprot:gene4961-biopygen3543
MGKGQDPICRIGGSAKPHEWVLGRSLLLQMPTKLPTSFAAAPVPQPVNHSGAILPAPFLDELSLAAVHLLVRDPLMELREGAVAHSGQTKFDPEPVAAHLQRWRPDR